MKDRNFNQTTPNQTETMKIDDVLIRIILEEVEKNASGASPVSIMIPMHYSPDEFDYHIEYLSKSGLIVHKPYKYLLDPVTLETVRLQQGGTYGLTPKGHDRLRELRSGFSFGKIVKFLLAVIGLLASVLTIWMFFF